MKEITVNQYDDLPSLYDENGNYVYDLNKLNIGDYYLLNKNTEYKDKNDKVSVYEIINKNNLSIESKITILKLK